ncbi:hypothetical protein FACS1894153_0540 [Bacteroidia bacterium]|nr:hypothetical protein FACS1894153_0540 [Bacteroidia bacterium]
MKKVKKNSPDNQPHYTKVGRLRKPVADAIHRKAANIYLDENHLKHIFNRHEKDLANLGLTPSMFVELVTTNFNRIYEGSGNSLLLVKWNGMPKVIAIELNFALKEEFYEVKTGLVMEKYKFNKKKVIMANIKKMEFVQSNMSALHIVPTYALASFPFTFRPQAHVLLRATDSRITS